MPAFPIVDSHVHFLDHARVPLSWTKSVPAMDRRFVPADLDDERGEVDIEAIVFVEVNVDQGQHLNEASWVAGLAADDPRIQAIVAHAPLHIGESVREDLQQLAKQPLIKGIRRLIQDDDAASLCASAAFRAGIRLLPEFGYHFEICVYHYQLGHALDLIDACPDVTFVVDHIAKPGIKAGVREPWWHEIAAAAALPNVVCKVSGVATEADHVTWHEDALRPYLERVFDLFGPERTLFGSDWPVMRMAIAYPRWVEIVDATMGHWPEADRRRFYVDNAKRLYRLS
ncbi:MAG: amidohydrolase family protein [Geminicoccaceae bacterium]